MKLYQSWQKSSLRKKKTFDGPGYFQTPSISKGKKETKVDGNDGQAVTSFYLINLFHLFSFRLYITMTHLSLINLLISYLY